MLRIALGNFHDAAVAGADSSAEAAAKAGSAKADRPGLSDRASAADENRVPNNKRAAELLGELGDYELLEEVGRGGQGWYFAPGKRVLIAQSP